MIMRDEHTTQLAFGFLRRTNLFGCADLPWIIDSVVSPILINPSLGLIYEIGL